MWNASGWRCDIKEASFYIQSSATPRRLDTESYFVGRTLSKLGDIYIILKKDLEECTVFSSTVSLVDYLMAAALSRF